MDLIGADRTGQRRADADSNAAAAAIIQCILTSSFYTSVPVTLEDYRVGDTIVDGVPALQADALISFSHPDLTTKGSRLRLVTVGTEPVRPCSSPWYRRRTLRTWPRPRVPSSR